MKRLQWMFAVLLLFAASAASAQSGKVVVQWLGHAAAKITTPGGKVIVIDPFLVNNPKTPEAYKKLEALGKVDLILVTHGHGDHYADVPALAKLNNAQVASNNGLGLSAQHLGILPANLVLRFNKSGMIMPLGPNIKITAVQANHSSELLWKNPATGKEETHVGGEPVGYIIELENGFKVYHMGDTGLFSDMTLIRDYYKPDLIMIPIGGHFTMGPQEAAYATREFLKPKYAIPIHYGTLPVLKGTPEEYIAALANAPTRVYALKPGEQVEF